MCFSRSVLALKLCGQPGFVFFFFSSPPSGAEIIALASWIMSAHSGHVSTPAGSHLASERNQNIKGFPRMILRCWPQVEEYWEWVGVGEGGLESGSCLTIHKGLSWIAVMVTSAGILFSPPHPFKCVSALLQASVYSSVQWDWSSLSLNTLQLLN